jgi:hypothetical protein
MLSGSYYADHSANNTKMKSTEKMKQGLKVLFILITIVILSSCKNDGDPIPAEATLEFSSAQLVNGVFRGVIGTTDPEGKIAIQLEGSAPAGIKSLTVVRNYLNDVGPQTHTIADFDELTDETEFDISVSYTVGTSDLSAETVLKAILIDNRDRELVVDLAQIDAYWPLDGASSISLDSDTEPGIDDYTYFLAINKIGNGPTGIPTIDPQGTSLSSVVAGNQSSKVHLVYDFDLTPKGGSPTGSYLCSPNHAATSNPELVEDFSTKHSTVLKVITYSALTLAEATKLSNIGPNDVAFLIDLYDRYQPGINTQRVTFNGAQGDVAFVLFKTDDGKIGLIKEHEITEGVEARIYFDLWMML